MSDNSKVTLVSEQPADQVDTLVKSKEYDVTNLILVN